ncbi:MAG: SRPBCC family protein [Stenotrophobium sp.]
MASIRRETLIAAPAATVWAAVRDVGAIHTRLARGFVTDTRLEDGGGARMVSFANGMLARELIVDLDDAQRRLAWSVVGGRMTHHNASLQVFDEGENRCRLVWLADLLPHELGPAIAGMIEQGLTAMQRTLQAAA